jgi:hypothetical protein
VVAHPFPSSCLFLFGTKDHRVNRYPSPPPASSSGSAIELVVPTKHKMATAHDNFVQKLAEGELESGSEKGQIDHLDGEKGLPSLTMPASRVFQAPEWIRALSPEERATREKHLLRKLDTRLMPMITLM